MSAFDFFDDIWCVSLPANAARWPVMQERFARLGIGSRVRRFSALPSPADARIGRALSHRRIVQDAAERGLRCVLAIEDETLFLDRTETILASAAAELRGRSWKLLYLGTWRGSDGLIAEPSCRHLMQTAGRVGPHAVAYAAEGYADLLARMPIGFATMQDFMGADGSIDTILAATPALAVHPAIATVPFCLPFQEPDDQDRFVP